MGLDEEYGVVSRSAETRDLRRKHGEILRFSTIKEYYTKSEGLGFLIQNLESTSVLNSGVWISYMNSIRQSIAESTFSI